MGPLPRDSVQPLNWSTWTVSVNHECVGERCKLTKCAQIQPQWQNLQSTPARTGVVPLPDGSTLAPIQVRKFLGFAAMIR